MKWRLPILNYQSVLKRYPEHLGTPYKDFGKVLRNGYGATIYLQAKPLASRLEEHRTFD